MYPNDPDFSLFLTTLQMAKTANPKMVIETLNANIAGFEDKIMAKDESFFMNYNLDYHLMMALAQVNPLPKAARTIVSPSFIFPCSQASVNAIGIEAAVVLPYFWMLLKT